jgi:hypothetical protein
VRGTSVGAADLLANHAAIFEGRVVGLPDPPELGLDAGYQERLAALEARVAELNARMGDREVHFDVLRSWKGADGSPVVHTPAQRTACGYPFEAGRSYLVFATRGEDGSLHVSACGQTRPSDEAGDDRALLDAYVATSRTPPVTPPRAGCAGCAVEGDAGEGSFGAFAIAIASLLAAYPFSRRRRHHPLG